MPSKPEESEDKLQSTSQVTAPTILREAIRAVPAVKFALGVAGIAAAVAIVYGLIGDPRVAVFGIILMFGLMTVLVVFSNFARTSHKSTVLPLLLGWTFVILTIATSILLFTSVFFNSPLPLSSRMMLTPTSTPTPTPVPTPTPTSSASVKVKFISPVHS